MATECVPQEWAKTFGLLPQTSPIAVNHPRMSLRPSHNSGLQPILPKGYRPKGVVYRPLKSEPRLHPAFPVKHLPVACLPPGRTLTRANLISHQNGPTNQPTQIKANIISHQHGPLNQPSRISANIIDHQNGPPNQPPQIRANIVGHQIGPPNQLPQIRANIIGHQNGPPNQPPRISANIISHQNEPPIQAPQIRANIIGHQNGPPNQPPRIRANIIGHQNGPPIQALQIRANIIGHQNGPLNQPSRISTNIISHQNGPPIQAHQIRANIIGHQNGPLNQPSRISTDIIGHQNGPPNQRPRILPVSWPIHPAFIGATGKPFFNPYNNFCVPPNQAGGDTPVRPVHFSSPCHNLQEHQQHKPEELKVDSEGANQGENVDNKGRDATDTSKDSNAMPEKISGEKDIGTIIINDERQCSLAKQDMADNTKTSESQESTTVDVDTYAAGLDLIPVKIIPKSTVWLNVTLQVDTSAEIKRGAGVQYRSLITNIVTEIYCPPQLNPPDDVMEDVTPATASYDERGRLTVLQLEFISAGIYKVETDGKTTLGKPSTRSVTLTQMDSLETLEPKSQYFILGDLCPVPKSFQKCHRNAQTLYKKLMEYMYSREFRKYTLPLLLESGEEDVWSAALKAPRTRSRAADHADSIFNRVSIKKRPPSPSQVDSRDGLETARKRRRCKERMTDSACSDTSAHPSPSASPSLDSQSARGCPPGPKRPDSLPVGENWSYPSATPSTSTPASTCSSPQSISEYSQRPELSSTTPGSSSSSPLSEVEYPQPSGSSWTPASTCSSPQSPEYPEYPSPSNSSSTPISSCSTPRPTTFSSSQGPSTPFGASPTYSTSESSSSYVTKFPKSIPSVVGCTTISLLDCETLGLSQNNELAPATLVTTESEMLNSGHFSPQYYSSPSYVSSFLEPLNIPELSLGDELDLTKPPELSPYIDSVPLDLSLPSANRYSLFR